MSSAPSPAGPSGAVPQSCWDLYRAFTLLALQGFGGVMAVAHREIVERRGWMSGEQYLQEVALNSCRSSCVNLLATWKPPEGLITKLYSPIP